MSHNTAFASANSSTKANRAASGFRSAAKLVPGENGELKVKIDEAGWLPLMASHDSNRTGGKKNLPNVKQTAVGWVDKVIAEIKSSGNSLMAADMIKAAINKRDPRNGEGEKLVGFTWILRLYRHFPSTIVELMSNGLLFGTHGCWGDIEKLMTEIYAESAGMTPTQMVAAWGPFVDGARDSILSQRKQDLNDLDRFLKAVSPKGHWANGGLRAYEMLNQCTVDGVWVLPHNMEKYRGRLSSSGKSGSLSPAALQKKPRWLALQKVVAMWSKQEHLDSIRETSGCDIQPLSLSWAGKWIGRETSDAGNIDRLYWWVANGAKLTKATLFSYYLRSELKSKDSRGNLIPYPSEATLPYRARKQFRVRTAALNACLDVTEVKMCADLWDRINFSRVTSICLARNNSAFLNEMLKSPPGSHQDATGNRHPDRHSRVKCRQNLRDFTTDPEKMEKLNAGACFPHHIIHDIETADSTAKVDLHNARYTSLLAKIRASQEETRQKIIEEASSVASGPSSTKKAAQETVMKAMSSGNFLPMVDVSESMTWDHAAPERPIDVATACGITLSQIANPAWNGLLVSFTDHPRIFDTKGKNVGRIKADIYMNKGYNTDFYKAQMAILNHLKSSGASDDDIPVLVVFTDGEWDTQDRTSSRTGGWSTMHQKIEREYATAGFKRTPLIVYWILKKGRNGVQTRDNHPGCIFLQGQSPNLFKWILYGETMPDTETEVVVDGKVTKMKTSSATPYGIFRKSMADAHLEAVDLVLQGSREKELAGYTPEFASHHAA